MSNLRQFLRPWLGEASNPIIIWLASGRSSTPTPRGLYRSCVDRQEAPSERLWPPISTLMGERQWAHSWAQNFPRTMTPGERVPRWPRCRQGKNRHNSEIKVRAVLRQNIGALVEDEDDPPLLYFHSIPEFWVRSTLHVQQRRAAEQNLTGAVHRAALALLLGDSGHGHVLRGLLHFQVGLLASSRRNVSGFNMLTESPRSIGNIEPFFSYEYPLCWGLHEEGCTVNTTRAPDYMQIVGIIMGMVTLGYIGDQIGRALSLSILLLSLLDLEGKQVLEPWSSAGKWGSVCTVSIMMVGCILLTLTGLGTSDKGMVIMYIVSQFVFGYGVGGEYPMAAGSAAERAEAGGRKAAMHRGREVVMTFSMQGVFPA